MMLKQVSKKLSTTKNKVSRSWQSYRTQKAKIFSRNIGKEFQKGLRDELLQKTRQKISKQYEDYRSTKYALTHKSDLSGFALTKRRTTENTIQKTYKLSNPDNVRTLNSTVEKLCSKSNVHGVLVIFKVYDEEQGRYHFGSKFVTSGRLKRLAELNKTIFDDISENLSFTQSCQDFELKSVYIRIVYAKT